LVAPPLILLKEYWRRRSEGRNLKSSAPMDFEKEMRRKDVEKEMRRKDVEKEMRRKDVEKEMRRKDVRNQGNIDSLHVQREGRV
jgi:hypothetical protein